MSLRPIINQTKFFIQKKEPIFNIRPKKSHSKIRKENALNTSSRSMKNLSQKNHQIEECLAQLRTLVQEQRTLTHILFEKIQKIFRQKLLKKPKECLVTLQVQDKKQEFEQFETLQPLKLSSRLNLKSTKDLLKGKQNFKDLMQQFQSKGPEEIKLKKVGTKIKRLFQEQSQKNEQNTINQLKENQQKLENLLKQKSIQIQDLNIQIQSLKVSKQMLQKKLIQQKKYASKIQKQYKNQIHQLELSSKEMSHSKELIWSQIKQRQTELLCLWQAKLQLKV